MTTGDSIMIDLDMFFSRILGRVFFSTMGANDGIEIIGGEGGFVGYICFFGSCLGIFAVSSLGFEYGLAS